MTPENNPPPIHNDQEFSDGWKPPENWQILFTAEEITILQKIKKADANEIIHARITASDNLISKAKNFGELSGSAEKQYLRKKGEPDWNEVLHDAQKEFGSKMNDSNQNL